MVLLLRYSGLRIQDAACLERSRLVNDKLFLYQQKTGTPVYCPLPPVVVEGLARVQNNNDQYFFYDGKSQPQSMVKSWDRIFQKGFCDVQTGHQRRSPAPLPRHVRGLATPQRRVDRDCVKAARPQLNQSH